MAALLDRPLLYVTGKGGVGKTTVALALALLARDAGRRTCVVEVGGQGRIPALYGRQAAAGGQEQQLADGLWSMTVDARAALRDWFATLVPRRLAGLLVASGTFSTFAEAAPGARELAAAAQFWELLQARRWTGAVPFDTVVVDAPASGHGLGLLRAPATFAEIAAVGPLGRQAAGLRDFLADPQRTGLIAVSQPAELSVSETLGLQADVTLAAIVANGVLPRRFTRAQVHAVEAAAGAALGAVVGNAASRGREQQAQLRRLRRHATAPVHALPWMAEACLGLEGIGRLAGTLDRELARDAR